MDGAPTGLRGVSIDIATMTQNPPNEDKLLLRKTSSTQRIDHMTSYVQEIELSVLIATILESWKLIAGMILLLLFISLAYIVLAQPIYRADVLLQIEEKSKGIGALTELTGLVQEESPVNAEFEIIKSRMVIGSVVGNLKLDIEARPDYLPVVGSFFTNPDERIQVEKFEVPDSYKGEEFELVSGKDGAYLLYDPDGNFLAKGKVGEPVNKSLGNEEAIYLFVSELKGEPGESYSLTRLSLLQAINSLKKTLSISEQGKQSGILRLTLDGPDPQKITTILNEIANIYLRQSVERKSAEAEKTLVFLNKQLPILKEKVENAEAELNRYRLEKGSVDLTLETKTTLEKIVSVDALLTQLRRDREELIRQFTPQHPRIAAIDAQIADLNNELKKVDSKVKGLPGTQQEVLRLTRDLEVSSALYTSLMNSAQELKIVKAGAVGNVRIVDYAVIPIKPIKPNKEVIVSLSLMLGVLLGVVAALIRKSLRGVVRDPDLIESKLNLPILAVVPYSVAQRKLNKKLRSGVNEPAILAVADSEDRAIEGLRSLRTSLFFSKFKAKNNIILLTSPGPGAGKSFVSINMGAVLADVDKRVLIIDADLRKGRIHQFLGIKRRPGLSDLLVDDVEINKVVCKTEVNNLYAITTGTIKNNPSELLLRPNFLKVLEYCAANFDQVIIDSPPVLAVTDAAIIARLAGSTLIVVRDGQNPLREIEQSVKCLDQVGINLRGAVFNGMDETSNRYGYGRYYGYAYSYSDKK